MSSVGPCLYIIYAKDLKPISPVNVILKYADDTTLLVPQNSPTTLEVEFSHILQWSGINKLKLNTHKTKEIVFHRPRLPNRSLPPFIPVFAKILGVVFTSTLP